MKAKARVSLVLAVATTAAAGSVAAQQADSIEAAMPLLHGDDSVATIGAACGITDQSAFTRRFRSTVGMAPRAYRATIANQPAVTD